VAHFVPSRGTFCSFPWHILFLPVAHFVPSRGTWYSVPSCQELQVKNCKSRIANKSILDSLTFFSRGLMNERIFSLVRLFSALFVHLLGNFKYTKMALEPKRKYLEKQTLEKI
jgi:hypothetical protein